MADNPLRKHRSIRLALAALVVLLGALPWLVSVGQQSLASMLNAPPLWVPATLPYRQDFDWFRAKFHAEDMLIVGFEGASLDNPAVERLATALASPTAELPHQQLLQDSIQSVASGPGVLQELLDGRVGLTRRAAVSRLRGSLVGDDGRSTCVLVALTAQGARDRDKAIAAILDVTGRVAQIPAEDVHLAGAPVDGAAIDAASVNAIGRLSVPSTIATALLCVALLRSWLLTGAIILVAVFGQALVLAVVALSGHPMNAVLTVMPALVFVLTVSAGVHLTNYFRDGLTAIGPDAAVRFALRRGATPCLLATATTVVGLLSLLASELSPIRTFGVIASVGVTVCLAALLMLMPGVMQWLLARRQWRGSELHTAAKPSRVAAAFNHVYRVVSGSPVAVSVVFIALMLGAGWGLTLVRTSVSVESLFPPSSRVLTDRDWLQQHVGPMVSLDIIVQFPDEARVAPIEQLTLVGEITRVVSRADGLGGALSAATFFPDIPRAGGLRNLTTRGIVRGRLDEELPALEKTDYLVHEQGQWSWRINARAQSDSSTDYGAVLRKLDTLVAPLLDRHASAQATAFYTGALPVAYEAQHVLLKSLFRSFLTAFAVVTLVMMVVMRSVAGGLLAMLPNLLPTVVMFGLMGWLDVAVDIGAVMTASVALGIAVDDTLHFLFWWRGELRRGATAGEAVRSAYQSCGVAMVETTAICGLGLMAYAFSSFVPTQRFAWCMLGLLTAALAGDLLLLPSLLLGPLGRLLRGSQRAARQAPEPRQHASAPEAAL